MFLLNSLHADYETVTPEGDDEEKGDASALRSNDSGEHYPESDDYLHEGDEEREEQERERERGRDHGSDHTADREDWEDGDQEGSADDEIDH